MGLIIAILLGLRHATDPDHLTAVSTLVLSDQRDGTRRAATLGLAWGLGHASTLFAFGLPVVLLQRYLPPSAQRLAEALIGVVIAALAIRLLVRWKRGYFHSHAHAHGAVRHSHPHVHENAPGGHTPAGHSHGHAEGLGRSPLAAFGIGLVHGIGGSAAVGILLMSATPGRTHAVIALALFAAATAVSMAALSTLFAFCLARAPVARHLARLVPVLGTVSLVFGVWYGWRAVGGSG